MLPPQRPIGFVQLGLSELFVVGLIDIRTGEGKSFSAMVPARERPFSSISAQSEHNLG
jgi:hypothetical protein